MRDFKDKEEREKDRSWKTAFVVVQDEDGNVFVDNSTSNFKDRVHRECSRSDAIYMLRTALDEFENDKVMMRLQQMIQGALTDGVH